MRKSATLQLFNSQKKKAEDEAKKEMIAKIKALKAAADQVINVAAAAAKLRAVKPKPEEDATTDGEETTGESDVADLVASKLQKILDADKAVAVASSRVQFVLAGFLPVFCRVFPQKSAKTRPKIIAKKPAKSPSEENGF